MTPLWRGTQPLVLASRSASRRAMLAAAGLPIEVSVPEVDERAVEAAAGPLAPAKVAMLLAREKAKAIARDKPGPADHRRRPDPGAEGAAASTNHLMPAGGARPARGFGRQYSISSIPCVAVVRDEDVLLDAVDTASLTMRPLSDAFLDAYLAAAGPRGHWKASVATNLKS